MLYFWALQTRELHTDSTPLGKVPDMDSPTLHFPACPVQFELLQLQREIHHQLLTRSHVYKWHSHMEYTLHLKATITSTGIRVTTLPGNKGHKWSALTVHSSPLLGTALHYWSMLRMTDNNYGNNGYARYGHLLMQCLWLQLTSAPVACHAWHTETRRLPGFPMAIGSSVADVGE